MVRFTVTVELRKYPKGNVTETLEEHYNTWLEADQAYEHWHGLVKKANSKVVHVWLKEHKETIEHKEAYKGQSEGPGSINGDLNVKQLPRTGTR
jgi:hypothetical protein